MPSRSYHQPPDRQPPKLLTKPQLTLRQLAQSTHRPDRLTAKGVRLADVKRTNPPRGLKGYAVMRGRTLTADNQHQHTIRCFFPADEHSLTPNSKIIVDCTCKRHAFYYEVANAHKGNSFLYRSNGARPEITNPRMRVGLCKHSFRFLSYLLKQGQTARDRAANAHPVVTPGESVVSARPPSVRPAPSVARRK